MLLSELTTQDVAILGAGREGLAVWRALRKLAPAMPITLYSESGLESAVADQFGSLDLVRVGPLDGTTLSAHDVIVRSPGFSPYRPELRHARESGVVFTSSSSLWLRANPAAKTLCITGTKGKSTATALVTHLLNAAGYRATMAGNIGRPLIGCEPGDADWWVVELSSYQLCDLDAEPDLSLILNLSDEHLDWHGSATQYRRDKLRLAELTPTGRLIANHADPELRAAFGHRPQMKWFNQAPGFKVLGDQVVLGDGEIRISAPAQLPGQHNLHNLAAALTAVNVLGALPGDIPAALARFEALPHRLNPVVTQDDLSYYDDSLSTTPVATLAALDALAGRAVTVLVGGLDRGLDWAPLAQRFTALAPFAVIGMPDSGAQICARLQAAGFAAPGGVHTVDSLAEGVRLASQITPGGGVVLLSPGAPSFPLFRDYQERAEAFVRAVRKQRPQDEGD